LQSLSVPLIAPHVGGKQWGPRYLLTSVPLISLAVVLVLDEMFAKASRSAWSDRARRLAVILLVAACSAGLYRNTVEATQDLANDYRTRVLPALRLVRESDDRIVAVSSQFVAHELAAAWDHSKFLLAKGPDELWALAVRLKEHGIKRFLFLRWVTQANPIPDSDGDAGRLECHYLGEYGADYHAYEAIFVDRTPGPPTNSD
jgi:hypothetical protein